MKNSHQKTSLATKIGAAALVLTPAVMVGFAVASSPESLSDTFAKGLSSSVASVPDTLRSFEKLDLAGNYPARKF